MYIPLKEIKNIHTGKDIYVIGSGASLNHIDKSFFEGKITIGINYIPKFIRCTYGLFRDWETDEGFNGIHKIYTENGAEFITLKTAGINSEYSHELKTNKKYYIGDCGAWTSFVNLSDIGTDNIINSHNTSATAVHLAYYLGAKNIILCGIDNGMIDGEINIEGYYSNEALEAIADNGIKRKEWLTNTYSHPYLLHDLKKVKERLKELGCNMVSINPFLTLGLEGHKYEQSPIPKDQMWAGDLK